MRPIAPKQIIREYTYAYGAVFPLDGDFDSLILPDMYADVLSIFLEEVSSRHPDDYILMVMDGAPCHRSGILNVPKNIEILKLPPYSPQLNPQENIWDEMREKWFGNTVFKDMNAVKQRMVEALCILEQDRIRIQSITGWKWIIDAIK